MTIYILPVTHAGSSSHIPIPSGIEIETLNSTSFKISWEPVSYPSHIIIHDDDDDTLQINYVGNSSYVVMGGLQHLKFYSIIVMHVSGNRYGAGVEFHVLEAGLL